MSTSARAEEFLATANFVDDALCVPYKAFGRTKGGWDCWGLIYCAYKEVLGIELPVYADYKEPFEKNAIYVQEVDGDIWRRVLTPENMDLVMIKTGKLVVHAGLYVGNGAMLHSTDKRGTRCERLSSPLWSKKIESYGRLCARSNHD